MSVNNKIILCQTKDGSSRTVIFKEEIWFVAEDLCKWLGYSNPAEAIKKYCKQARVIKPSNFTQNLSSVPLPSSNLTIVDLLDSYRLTVYFGPPGFEQIKGMPPGIIKQLGLRVYLTDLRNFTDTTSKEDPLYAKALKEFIASVEEEHLQPLPAICDKWEFAKKIRAGKVTMSDIKQNNKLEEP